MTWLIYLTSITRKAHGTYRCINKGMDDGLLWSYVVDEISVSRDKAMTLNGQPLHCHMTIPGIEPGLQPETVLP